MRCIEHMGKIVEYYEYYLSSSSCIFTFFNGDDSEIQQLFGSDIIDSVIISDDETGRKDVINLNMQLKNIRKETGSIIKKQYKVIKASYYTEDPVVDMSAGEPMVDGDGTPIVCTTFHPAEIETTTSEEQGFITTVTLEPPSIYDRVNNISTKIQNQSISYAVSQIIAQSFTDTQALQVKKIYPTFEDLVENKYQAEETGYKFIYNGELYKTAQPNLIFQSQYIPGQGTESLYTHIDEAHSGTLEDPIPAVSNMEYFQNKYYIEDSTIYLCNSELAKSGVVLQFVPSQLVGIYFEKVEVDSEG